MSREDAELCAKCNLGRWRHVAGVVKHAFEPTRGTSTVLVNHAFVAPDPMCAGCKDCKPEPARAEAPQGETWAAEDIARAKELADGYKDVFPDGPHVESLRAAQPETGDEGRDDVIVGEVLRRFGLPCPTLSVGTNDRVCIAVRAAVRAARRDENLACERLMNEVEPKADISFVLRGAFRDAIAARRGKEET
jgi:hypothetical protein